MSRVTPSEPLPRGVSFNASANKWQARVQVGGVRLHLGYADSPQKAGELYAEFKKLKGSKRQLYLNGGAVTDQADRPVPPQAKSKVATGPIEVGNWFLDSCYARSQPSELSGRELLEAWRPYQKARRICDKNALPLLAVTIVWPLLAKVRHDPTKDQETQWAELCNRLRADGVLLRISEPVVEAVWSQTEHNGQTVGDIVERLEEMLEFV